MKENEKKRLYGLINLAYQKNGKKDDYSHPYGVIYNSLKSCELRIDKYSCGARCPDKDLVNYVFKYDDDEIYTSLSYVKKSLVLLCETLLDDDEEMCTDEDAEITVEFKKTYDLEKLEFAPKNSFENCENIVLKNIRNAIHSIYIAMGWLTNEKIINELITKSNEGIDIFVIVDNNDININARKKHPQLPFPVFYVTNMNIYWNNHTTMHLKFCIIDNSKVIYGTYNWTEKANYNDESITEDNNINSVNDYLKEFKLLKVKYSCMLDYPSYIK